MTQTLFLMKPMKTLLTFTVLLGVRSVMLGQSAQAPVANRTYHALLDRTRSNDQSLAPVGFE